MLQHLALHGVDATHRSLSAEGRGVGDVLADCARMHNADLIVMGAYGTSRFREFVLGGATKSLLSHSQVPLFMSH
ncbi:MAG: universal stress protein [Reyranella sp.]|nr:universal stress protein [Reyranella sp.]